jgi:hypothetical protein
MIAFELGPRTAFTTRCFVSRAFRSDPTRGLAVFAVLALMGLPTTGLAQQAPHKHGDLDFDGCVGSKDYALFLDHFGEDVTTIPEAADCQDAWNPTNSGVLSFMDFGILAANMGSAPECHSDPPGPITCAVYNSCGITQCETSTCELPDNGSGTVDLPPEGCPYLTADELHMMIGGLPEGTEIRVGVIHGGFTNITRTSGGTFGTGGEIEQFESTLTLEMQGTGSLATFNRSIELTAVPTEIHTAPRGGGPFQVFEAAMISLEGSLPGALVADPDFQTLTVSAGEVAGMSSPGGTALSASEGGFEVDSSFVAAYEISFVGAAGGALDGLSGTTQGKVSVPEPAGPLSLGPGLMLLAWLDRRRRRSAVD